MKFNKYINEELESLDSSSPEEISHLIKKKCSKYLKLIGNRKPLYRGMESQYAQAGKYPNKVYIGKKAVRKNRTPKGTEQITFKFVNDWLSNKGWPRRDSSMICTSNETWANTFGNAFYVFPINSSYGYAWVDSHDFNTMSLKDMGEWNIGELEDHAHNNPKEGIKMLEDHVRGNKKFNAAYNREYEIWIDCKEYYFLGYDLMMMEEQKKFKKAFKKIGLTL